MLLLLGLLVRQTDFSVRQAIHTLTGIEPWLLVAIGLSSTVQMLVSAAKWRMVSHKLLPLSSAQAGPAFFFFYTSVGGALSQVLPIHVSCLAARAAAVKLHHGESGKRGAVSSAYEQAFDLLVPALLVPASILTIPRMTAFSFWLSCSALTLSLAALAFGLRGSRIMGGLQYWLEAFAAHVRMLGGISRLIASAHQLGLFDNGLLLRMFVLSIGRYAAHVARAILIAWAVGIEVHPTDIIVIIPLIQLALLVALTPGSLGIAEWSWVGLLSLMGVSLESAGLFAITHKLLIFTTLCATCGVAGLLYAAEHRIRSWSRAGGLQSQLDGGPHLDPHTRRQDDRSL
jgi:uncharacterized protein (TIRG00374 family)